jgi:hypothetical protein
MMNRSRRKIFGALAGLALAVGMVGAGAAPASALGAGQCGAAGWEFNFLRTSGTVAQSCGAGTTVRYTVGCGLGKKSVTVYFGRNGSSQLTPLPGCALGYNGFGWQRV